MDYFVLINKEHEVIEGMLQVFKELLSRLGRAKAVNLVHLENIMQVWRDYFCREHFNHEEEGVFDLLNKIEHPYLTDLIEAHEKLNVKLTKLEDVLQKLRVGRANSGRELVKLGEDFSWNLEVHLREEKRIYNELERSEDMNGGILTAPAENLPSYEHSGEKNLRLARIGKLISDLSREYLGRSIVIISEEETNQKLRATTGAGMETTKQETGLDLKEPVHEDSAESLENDDKTPSRPSAQDLSTGEEITGDISPKKKTSESDG